MNKSSVNNKSLGINYFCKLKFSYKKECFYFWTISLTIILQFLKVQFNINFGKPVFSRDNYLDKKRVKERKTHSNGIQVTWNSMKDSQNIVSKYSKNLQKTIFRKMCRKSLKKLIIVQNSISRILLIIFSIVYENAFV